MRKTNLQVRIWAGRLILAGRTRADVERRTKLSKGVVGNIARTVLRHGLDGLRTGADRKASRAKPAGGFAFGPPRPRPCLLCGDPRPSVALYCHRCEEHQRRASRVASRVNASRRADSLAPVELRGRGLKLS